MAKQTPADLRSAYLDFGAAASLAPENAEANFFKALTMVALEQDSSDFRSQLTDFGIKILNPNIYDFVYELPIDENRRLKPKDGARSEQTLAYLRRQSSLIDQALADLQKISSESFQLTLTAAETSVADTRVDHADVRILRCWLQLAKAALILGESYNLSAEYALFHRLFNQGRLDPAGVLAALPELLRYSDTSDLRSGARPHLLAANDEFQRAYVFIKDRRQVAGSIPHLFEFIDLDGAGRLATELQAIAASLNGRIVYPAIDQTGSLLAGQPLDLSRAFASSTKPPRELLPRAFDRGFFRPGTWSDSTLGGILPAGTQEQLDRFALEAGVLQNTRYDPYDFSIWVDRRAGGTPEQPAPRILGEIAGLDVDLNGNVYVVDPGEHVIKKIAIDGTVTTVAGLPWRNWEEREELIRRSYLGPQDDDSYWHSDRRSADIFDYPRRLAVDPSGKVYFIEGERIMRLMPNGRVSVFAGREREWWRYDENGTDGKGAAATFVYPNDLACDGAGNVYVGDDYAIRKITPDGTVTTLAGRSGPGRANRGYVDGAGSVARFEWIESIAATSSGIVYVNDRGNRVIRKVLPDGTTSTFVGGPNAPSELYYDARSPLAGLVTPRGLAVDAEGNLYFSDNETIRKVSPTGEVVTLGGRPSEGGLTMGVGDRARLGGDSDEFFRFLAVDRRGTLYGANYDGTVIRGTSVTRLPTGDPFPQPTPYPQPPAGGRTGPPWPQPPRPGASPPPLPTPTPVPVAGQISNFTLQTNEVSLDGNEVSLVYQGAYTGDLQSISVSFAHADSPQIISAWVYPSLNPGVGSRSFTGNLLIPSYTAAGEWRVRSVQINWADGTYEYHPRWNNGQYDPLPETFASAYFTVSNTQPADTTAPEILGLTVSPKLINATSQPQTPRLRVALRDDLSGFSELEIRFRSLQSSEEKIVRIYTQDLFSVSAEQNVYEKLLDIASGSAEGEWVVDEIYVYDRVGNWTRFLRDYDPGAWYKDDPRYQPLTAFMQEAGFTNSSQAAVYQPPVDENPPEILSVRWEPATVDASSDGARIKVRVQARDDVSGVQWLNLTAGFLGYGRGVSSAWVGNFELVEGSVLDGVFEAVLELPRTSLPGPWGVQWISADDGAGNEQEYTRWEGLMPGRILHSHFTVNSVSDLPLPVLQGIQVVLGGTAGQVDTLGGPAELSVKFRLTNAFPREPDEAWPPYLGTIGVRSPSGTQYLWSEFGEEHLVEGTLADGWYEVVFRLPQYSENGLWTLDSLELLDAWDGTHLWDEARLVEASLAVPEFTVLGVPRTWSQQQFALPSAKQAVGLSFGNLNFIYDGAEKIPAVTAEIAGLESNIVLTYDGTTTAPIDPGSYFVVAFLAHPTYSARASATMAIARTPTPEPTPLLSVDGSFAGNFISNHDDPRVVAADSGQLVMRAKGGRVTGKLLVDGQRINLPRGRFREEGQAVVLEADLVTKAQRRIRLNLTGSPVGDRLHFVASISGDLSVPSFKVHPVGASSTVRGWQFNSALSSERGLGHGFTVAKVDNKGSRVRLASVLADGTKATASALLLDDENKNTLIPLAAPLKKNAGLLIGDIALDAAGPVPRLNGEAKWSRPGAAENLLWSGSRWTPPVKGNNVLRGSASSVPFVLSVVNGTRFEGVWPGSNQPEFTPPVEGLQLKAVAKTGLFRGSWPAAGSSSKPVKFSGVLFQDAEGATVGRGFRLEGFRSDALEITAP